MSRLYGSWELGHSSIWLDKNTKTTTSHRIGKWWMRSNWGSDLRTITGRYSVCYGTCSNSQFKIVSTARWFNIRSGCSNQNIRRTSRNPYSTASTKRQPSRKPKTSTTQGASRSRAKSSFQNTKKDYIWICLTVCRRLQKVFTRPGHVPPRCLRLATLQTCSKDSENMKRRSLKNRLSI